MGRFTVMLIVALTMLAARTPGSSARAALPGIAAHDVVVFGAVPNPLPHVPSWQLIPSTLAVASEGRALYVVDPLLGVAVRFGAGKQFGQERTVKLAWHAGSPSDPEIAVTSANDGRALFVATNHGVWALDTHTLVIRTRYLPGLPFASVALSPDGRRLYALRAFHPVLYVFDAANGRLLGSHSFPVMALLSIQQITSNR